MAKGTVRGFLKRHLPPPIRAVFRGLLSYTQRVSRWMIILWQVRGTGIKDAGALLLSALAAPILSARRLGQWQDPILLCDAVVSVPGIGRFALRARTDDLWHVLPWREHAIAELLRSRLRPGDVFVDAGANIGVYTVLAARLVGQRGRVVSVEMMPDTAARLREHVQLNQLGNVTIVERALSSKAGQVVVATVQHGKHGQATIVRDSGRIGLGSEVNVSTTTLDDVAADLPHVRLMKIDVEGSEYDALSGACRILSRLDALVYESWGSLRKGGDPVDRLLETSGFTLRKIDGNNWIAEKRVLRLRATDLVGK